MVQEKHSSANLRSRGGFTNRFRKVDAFSCTPLKMRVGSGFKRRQGVIVVQRICQRAPICISIEVLIINVTYDVTYPVLRGAAGIVVQTVRVLLSLAARLSSHLPPGFILNHLSLALNT